ncbi:MAG: sigma-70 family RNA polymerase sigma factor [Oliverpabstia sp.]
MTNEQFVHMIQNAVSPAELMLQLWQQNYGLIYRIANRYKSLDDIEDLLQEGFLGLYEAVRHYDPETGVPFVNYAALWIRQAIGRYVKSNGTVRIPEHAGNQVRAYRRMVSRWESEFGRKPTEGEICRYLDVTPGMLRQIEKDGQMGQIQSLDVPLGEEEDSSMYDLVPGNSDQEEEIVERMQQEQLRDEVWKIVDNLPEEQSTIIRMRYQHGCTLKEAGEALGISISQAKTVESKAFREIRKPSNSRRLMLFLEDDIRSRAMSGNGVSSFQNSWTSSTERTALWMEGDMERYLELMRRDCGL